MWDLRHAGGDSSLSEDTVSQANGSVVASRGELHNQIYSWEMTVQNIVQKNHTMKALNVCSHLKQMFQKEAHQTDYHWKKHCNW